MAAQRVYGGSVTVETNTTASTSVGAGVSAVRVQGDCGDDGHTPAAGPRPALLPAAGGGAGHAPTTFRRAATRGARLNPTPHDCGSRIAVLTDAGWFCSGCGEAFAVTLTDTREDAA